MDFFQKSPIRDVVFKSICQITNAEIIAASLYAAIKTLQSREAPNIADKDEGKQIKDGQKILMVSTKRMRSSCMMDDDDRWSPMMQIMHKTVEMLMQGRVDLATCFSLVCDVDIWVLAVEKNHLLYMYLTSRLRMQF